MTFTGFFDKIRGTFGTPLPPPLTVSYPEPWVTNFHTLKEKIDALPDPAASVDSALTLDSPIQEDMISDAFGWLTYRDVCWRTVTSAIDFMSEHRYTVYPPDSMVKLQKYWQEQLEDFVDEHENYFKALLEKEAADDRSGREKLLEAALRVAEQLIDADSKYTRTPDQDRLLMNRWCLLYGRLKDFDP